MWVCVWPGAPGDPSPMSPAVRSNRSNRRLAPLNSFLIVLIAVLMFTKMYKNKLETLDDDLQNSNKLSSKNDPIKSDHGQLDEFTDYSNCNLHFHSYTFYDPKANTNCPVKIQE